MRRKLAHSWLAAALGGALFLGCQSAERNPYQADPLIVTKKPIESKPAEAEPVRVVMVEPTAPPLPPVALAAAKPLEPLPPRAPTAVASPVPRPLEPVRPIQPAKASVPAATVSRPVDKPAVEANPAMRRPVPGTYGHAPDYSWLQGTLDQHYHGHLELRYCDHATEDQWGGKVCLDDDPRLAQFKEADVIHVEGTLIPDPDKTARSGWHHYPHFRIRDIQKVPPGQ